MARSRTGGSTRLLTLLDKLIVTLLVYANLSLAEYTQGFAGAGLATAARLRYDPTTYLVAREIFPDDFDVTSTALPIASVALLALAHFAVAALVMPRCLRFFMLMLYALVMLSAVCAEAWLARQVAADLHRHLREARDRLDGILWHMRVVLDLIAMMHHFVWKFKSIILEAQKNAPMNMTVAEQAFVAFVAFQVSAGVLAALAAIVGLRRARALALSDRTY